MAQRSSPPLPAAPELPPGAPGKNGYAFRQKFGVIVLCADEAHQAALFRRFRGEGLQCKVVST